MRIFPLWMKQRYSDLNTSVPTKASDPIPVHIVVQIPPTHPFWHTQTRKNWL
jgi:hypothetical protein